MRQNQPVQIQRLRKRKARIAEELDEAAANDLVQESIREFCLRTKDRLVPLSGSCDSALREGTKVV
jgi:hypothetical protein